METEMYRIAHNNGVLKTRGRIVILDDANKGEYRHITDLLNYEGRAVVRVGTWIDYDSDSTIIYELDYGVLEQHHKEYSVANEIPKVVFCGIGQLPHVLFAKSLYSQYSSSGLPPDWRDKPKPLIP